MPHDRPTEYAVDAPLEDHQRRLTAIEERLSDLAIVQSALMIEYTTLTQIVKLRLRQSAHAAGRASSSSPCVADQEAYG